MSDPSAKRQRLDLTGRFSPASPPFAEAAKAASEQTTTTTTFHPRTPTSPPYSSMNSNPNGGLSMSSTVASSVKASKFAASMSQLTHSTASSTIVHPMMTSSNISGAILSTNVDSDGDAMMEYDGEDDVGRNHGYRRSNHDRQVQSLYTKEGRLKASMGISGSQLFFNDSNKNHSMSRPHPSQNLFRLYRLDSLASSVARNDPTTGEKINKLRKSYEGHIKHLQIAGKPKATKMDKVFLDILSIPAEDYDLLRVKGKEPERALSPDQTALDPSFSSFLDGAFAGMAPGPFASSDSAKIRAYIGTEDIVKPKAQEQPVHRTTLYASNSPTPGSSSAQRGPIRPERTGAKRGYTDATFQGYGEGFVDEYADLTGGEDNAQGNMAKRRKLQFERTSHSVEVGGVRR